MNKYEQRAVQERKAALRSSTMIWTAGAALIVVAIAILGVSSSASPRFFSKSAIAVAILLLVLRQVSRRLRNKKSRAAEPDPQSRLNLD
jgi:hypothetical protein